VRGADPVDRPFHFTIRGRATRLTLQIDGAALAQSLYLNHPLSLHRT
jgi:hypothetical protein